MADLDTLQKLSEQMEAAKKDALDELESEIKELASALKQEPGAILKEMRSRFDTSEEEPKKSERAVRKRPTVKAEEPLYKDAKSGNTWSGRGAKAKWLKEEIDNGKAEVDFLNPDHPKYNERLKKLQEKK